MRIASFNVNGVRSALNKGLIQWLMREKTDIVCLQEIKAQAEQIPTDELQALGYFTYWFPAVKKGYSGVGILSRIPALAVTYGMGIECYDAEGRVLQADFGTFQLVNSYHPSGTMGEHRQQFKMEWLEEFYHFAADKLETEPATIICGDFNICHKPIDIHDPVRNARSSGFTPEERDWMTDFLDLGFTDSFRRINKHPHHYTWWSLVSNARARNKGWRIDYIMVPDQLRHGIRHAWIDTSVYFSDHCPTCVELDL